MMKMERDIIDWEQHFWDGRGVELGKTGSVVRCKNCGDWMPTPSRLDDPRHKIVKCPQCGSNLKAQGELTHSQIVSRMKHSQGWRPFIVGEDVNRYYAIPSGYIDTSYKGINYKDDSFFEPPKLLVRKTGVGIYAAIDRTDALTNQVVFIFRPKSSATSTTTISLEYVLGILCSRAMLYYYAQRFGEKEWRSYPYVTQALIKKLPIPDPFSANRRDKNWHSRLFQPVDAVVSAKGAISKSYDLDIEDIVMDIYGLDEKERSRIYEVLEKMQKLRIVREMLYFEHLRGQP